METRIVKNLHQNYSSMREKKESITESKMNLVNFQRKEQMKFI